MNWAQAGSPDVHIVGTGQTPFTPSHRIDTSTADLMFSAASAALADASLTWGDIDGLGIASFTAAPDHSIDYAVRWSITPRWLMDSALGGASGIDLIDHARAALAIDAASNILLVAGDHFAGDDFAALVRGYNSSAARDFPSMPEVSPNSLFALLTTLQMAQCGLTREDYGRLVVSQRAWAAENPNAAYRDLLTLDEYLAAPMIAEPLSRLDCVPVVSGASAVVLSGTPHGDSVVVRGVKAQHNWDGQDGDGLVTGLRLAAPRLWSETGRAPKDLDVVSVYDDYPAMAIAQLVDCGIIEGAVGPGLLRLLEDGRPAVNSSGGQLSAGQSGAGAGMQGVVDVVNALRDRGPLRTHGSTLGLVTGYGMVTYRYGSCANAMLLERA